MAKVEVNMERWRYEKTGSYDTILFGAKIFDYEWIQTGEKVNIIDPLYGEKYCFSVYKVVIDKYEYIFAAGEFSNSVYGFYIPACI